MKTIVVIVLMIGCAAGVKAQNQQKQKGILPLQNYRLMTDSNFTSLYKGNLDSAINNKTLSRFMQPLIAMANIDHMPIASIKSTDPNMPVVQTDRTGYTMPVAGKNLPKVYTMKKPGAVFMQFKP